MIQRGFLFLAALCGIFAFSAAPAGAAELYKGQTLYVPVYTHIYHGPKAQTFSLTCTLSLRNTDMARPIEVIAVDYYDSYGKKLRSFLEDPLTIRPLATSRYILDVSEQKGGSGANFIVVWRSKEPVNPPIAEAIMIGTQGNQGISFTSRGVPLYVP
jgi:hypothetical protein